MSQNPGYVNRQVYFIRPYLPEAEIKQLILERRLPHITSLAYGDNQWVVIISQGTGYADTQPYLWRDYFPEAELQEYWTTGHHITSLAHGDPQWAVVMSQKQRG